jgi:hypothetical protein
VLSSHLQSLSLAAALVAGAVQAPAPVGGRIALGADVGRYEVLYGPPEFRALDDDSAKPWPTLRAIRTLGRLERILGRGRSGEASPGLGDAVQSGTAGGAAGGRAGEYDNPNAVYRICREHGCLVLTPVDEMRTTLDDAITLWLDRDVEVIGAIDEIILPSNLRRQAFLTWSFFEVPAAGTRPDGAGASTLEPLVRYPQGAEGRFVTVSGTFRGANLFGDMPQESQRRVGDWVLRDGPYSIWVSGKGPRGEGFSLDPRSRSDCHWRLEVVGRVEAKDGYLYLKARRVSLLRREREDEPRP